MIINKQRQLITLIIVHFIVMCMILKVVSVHYKPSMKRIPFKYSFCILQLSNKIIQFIEYKIKVEVCVNNIFWSYSLYIYKIVISYPLHFL